MRLIPVLVGALAACAPRAGTCEQDSECSDGELCTRNHACLPPAEVRAVHVTWTVGGVAASDASCQGLEFELEFVDPRGLDDPLAYSPVPCALGTFRIDKLPTAYTLVRVHRGRTSQTVEIDPASGEAAFETSAPRSRTS